MFCCWFGFAIYLATSQGFHISGHAEEPMGMRPVTFGTTNYISKSRRVIRVTPISQHYVMGKLVYSIQFKRNAGHLYRVPVSDRCGRAIA